ncbi:TPA: hypothetical protein MW242_002931 [Acinetobacter baumannii]|nr:hypothetical protein [Acinetobacter baumannii]
MMHDQNDTLYIIITAPTEEQFETVSNRLEKLAGQRVSVPLTDTRTFEGNLIRSMSRNMDEKEAYIGFAPFLAQKFMSELHELVKDLDFIEINKAEFNPVPSNIYSAKQPDKGPMMAFASPGSGKSIIQ